MINESTADKVIRREQQMAAARNVNDSLMRDIALHVQPRKAQSIGENSSISSSSPPIDEVDRLYDTTAMFANQTLGSGMHSNISPMGSVFAKFAAPGGTDLGHDVEQWFHQATQTLHREISASNFHSAVDELYLDHGGFGTAAMTCRMGRKGKLVFDTLEIGSYSIAEAEDRTVDTIYRSYQLTPRQIIQQFGDDVPAHVKEKAEDVATKDTPLEVVHAIEPREDYDESKIDAENMPIASVYVLKQTKELLLESGYHEQPFAVSRWRLWGKSPWGWSPSYYALPLARQVNFLEQCIDVGVERAAFPAWMVPSTLKGEFDPRPHGQNIYDASVGGDQAMPQELKSSGRLELAVDREEMKRKVIREAFFEDMFKLLSRMDKEATAYEVRELMAEKTTLFHPFFARLTTEFLQPILLRSFAELMRAGKFGQPPEGLFVKTESGYVMDDPEIEFSSRLALALEMGEVNGLLQTIQDLAPMAEILGTEVYDFINPAKAGPLIARSRGASSGAIRTAEEIEEMQAARAEAQAQAQQMEQAAQMAQAVGAVGGPDEAAKLIPDQ